MGPMTSVSESSNASADGTPATDYDSFAEAYTAENEHSLINASRPGGDLTARSLDRSVLTHLHQQRPQGRVFGAAQVLDEPFLGP